MRTRTSEYSILGMLSIQPMSGYEIRKNIHESIRHFWTEGYGQIYPTLKRLSRESLIVAAKPSGGGRSDRQAYVLTAKGKAHLSKWIAEKPETQPVRNQLLLKLFFGRTVSARVCVRHVREVLLEQQDLLKSYLQIKKQVRTEQEGHKDLPFWLMTINYGLHQTSAEIKWCRETLTVLRSREKKARKTRARRH